LRIVEWTYAGLTFRITINPADVDELMQQMGETRGEFMRAEPRQSQERHFRRRGAEN
jgi:hypothetical protein